MTETTYKKWLQVNIDHCRGIKDSLDQVNIGNLEAYENALHKYEESQMNTPENKKETEKKSIKLNTGCLPLIVIPMLIYVAYKLTYLYLSTCN